MNERIKEVRKDHKLTQEKFAERLGMKQNSIAQIEMGRRTSDQVVLSICREFGVFREWLETGEGPKYKKKPAGGIRREIADLMGVAEDSPIVDFFETLFNLPPEIRSAFESEFERVREENKKSSE